MTHPASEVTGGRRRYCKRVITGPERDAITADIRALMLKWRIGSTTLHRLAQIANREARA